MCLCESTTCLDVEVLLDEGRSNDRVDVVNGLGDTLASPLGLVTISDILLLLRVLSIGVEEEKTHLSSQASWEPVEAPEGTMAR